jgi:hypothetical protein
VLTEPLTAIRVHAREFATMAATLSVGLCVTRLGRAVPRFTRRHCDPLHMQRECETHGYRTDFEVFRLEGNVEDINSLS